MARGRKRRAESDIDVDSDSETEYTHHQLQSGSGDDDEEDDSETDPLSPVPDLPTQMVAEILSRLPIKTIFICRRVCKFWLSLISDPSFAKLHLSRSQVSLLVKSINRKYKPRQLQLVDLKIAPFVSARGARMKLTPRTNLPREPKVAFNFLNSCNGLLCLYEPKTKDPIYVCNPILGEYITLPRCPPGAKCNPRNSAFGFSPKTNQYKVVRSFRKGLLVPGATPKDYGEYELEIYTLGEGSWRNVDCMGNPPYSISNYSINASFNGALHWLMWRNDPDFICCFDFGTERFGAVPEPSEFTPHDKEYSHLMSLGVLGECLSLCDFSDEWRAMIWIMKDYGVKESWSKVYVTESMIFETDNHMDFYEPVMILENGKILVVFNNNGLFVYDPDEDLFVEDIHIYGIAKKFRAIGHIQSLVSLRDVAVGENVMMCRG